MKFEREHAGRNRNATFGNTGFHAVIVGRQSAIHGNRTGALKPAGQCVGAVHFLALQIGNRFDRELGEQVVGVRNLDTEIDLIVLVPGLVHRRHVLVQLLTDRVQGLQIAGHERCVKRDVHQRHFDRLPQGADPADIGKAVLDAFERILEIVE